MKDSLWGYNKWIHQVSGEWLYAEMNSRDFWKLGKEYVAKWVNDPDPSLHGDGLPHYLCPVILFIDSTLVSWRMVSEKNLSPSRRFSSQASVKSIFVPIDRDSLKLFMIDSGIGPDTFGKRVGVNWLMSKWAVTGVGGFDLALFGCTVILMRSLALLGGVLGGHVNVTLTKKTKG